MASVTWRYMGANTRHVELSRAAWLYTTLVSAGPATMSLLVPGSLDTVG